LIKKLLTSLLVLFVLVCFVGPVGAGEMSESGDKKQVFGWQLMTPEERTEHRERMMSFKTAEERSEYRSQHHKRMMERAKAEGVELPDKPRGVAIID